MLVYQEEKVSTKKGSRMRKIIILLLIFTTMKAEEKEQPHYTINMFIQEYPQANSTNQFKSITYQGLPKQLMKSAFYQPVNVGIYGIYSGYLSHTNDFGLLSFPRKTIREQFNLVITPEMKPRFLISNTIQQWQISDPKETKMYQVKRLKDPETKIYYWKVLEQNLPNDLQIPLHSIIILAKPKNIFVPFGVTVTNKSTNIVLPTIYAKRGLDRIKQALFVIKIKQFFAPTSFIQKTTDQDISKILIS